MYIGTVVGKKWNRVPFCCLASVPRFCLSSRKEEEERKKSQI